MISTPPLPPVAALPLQDALLLRAAHDIVLLAGGLMAASDSPLLALPLPSDRWDRSPLPILWGQRLEPCRERVEKLQATPSFAPTLSALRITADAFLNRLVTWGWLHADEPELGLVTDGTGLVLALNLPTRDAGPEWLIDLANGQTSGIDILPMAEKGIWPLIVMETNPILC